jgi:hypothetical protein
MAIAVPIGFLSTMKAENAVSRFNQTQGCVFLRIDVGNFAQSAVLPNGEENAAAPGNKGSRGKGKWPVSCSVITIEGSDQL